MSFTQKLAVLLLFSFIIGFAGGIVWGLKYADDREQGKWASVSRCA
jgi:hypothetical protein